jgi:hypothetical protein
MGSVQLYRWLFRAALLQFCRLSTTIRQARALLPYNGDLAARVHNVSSRFSATSSLLRYRTALFSQFSRRFGLRQLTRAKKTYLQHASRRGQRWYYAGAIQDYRRLAVSRNRGFGAYLKSCPAR